MRALTVHPCSATGYVIALGFVLWILSWTAARFYIRRARDRRRFRIHLRRARQ
jgi:hypothetical protein